jgi:hypothetical protein
MPNTKYMDEHTIDPLQFENFNWLSTGLMIEALQIGDFAKNTIQDRWVIRTEDGICECDGVGSPLFKLRLDQEILGARWKICPLFVTCREAINALTDGKTIIQSFTDSPTKWKYQYDGEYINTWVSDDGANWTSWTDCNGKGAITSLDGLWQIVGG